MYFSISYRYSIITLFDNVYRTNDMCLCCNISILCMLSCSIFIRYQKWIIQLDWLKQITNEILQYLPYHKSMPEIKKRECLTDFDLLDVVTISYILRNWQSNSRPFFKKILRKHDILSLWSQAQKCGRRYAKLIVVIPTNKLIWHTIWNKIATCYSIIDSIDLSEFLAVIKFEWFSWSIGIFATYFWQIIYWLCHISMMVLHLAYGKF